MVDTEPTRRRLRRARAHASRRGVVTIAACLGTGALMALSLPPWGWWPLLIVGVVFLDRLLAGQPARSRFWRGWAGRRGVALPRHGVDGLPHGAGLGRRVA